MEEITFITEDRVKISGNYFKSKKEHAPVFLLLHMMPATKESWNEFAAHLQNKGFAALAIDLRGHGRSTDKNGTRLDYKEFKDSEHRESMKDIAAAKEFLKGKGVDISGMAIAGASIGANLALWQASIDKDVSLLILLSPGLNYRGIQAAQLAPHYSGPVYILTSEMDATNAAQSSRELFKIFPGDKELNIRQGNSHGTNMFIQEPDLIDKLLEWTTNKIYKY
ncbi:hypothetical protein METP2_03592 [Methanosarcinales archaeon]|nr:alpha/beta fold hydrolase [Candidatus Methanoperedens sp.]CAG1004798.1 hypothetical protein METP2_03592 [Methanosarcinales archaeon]